MLNKKTATKTLKHKISQKSECNSKIFCIKFSENLVLLCFSGRKVIKLQGIL